MFTLLILFLTAALVGITYGRSRILNVLLAMMFVGHVVIWQDTSNWPGLLSPVFVDALGIWVLIIIAGLAFGTICQRCSRRQNNAQ